MQKRFFPDGKDNKKRSFQDYHWNRFKNFDPRDMYTVVSEHVFPWLRTLGGNGTTYSKHLEGARFTIPTPALLAKVVDMIDKVPWCFSAGFGYPVHRTNTLRARG